MGATRTNAAALVFPGVNRVESRPGLWSRKPKRELGFCSAEPQMDPKTSAGLVDSKPQAFFGGWDFNLGPTHGFSVKKKCFTFEHISEPSLEVHPKTHIAFVR